MTIHDEYMLRMKELNQAYPALQLPPTSFTEMRAEVVGFEEGQSLSVRFPFDVRFTNPMGVFQGGMLCTAADNVFGPLSYSAAKGPCVTLDMSARYMRPFTQKESPITVTAKVISRTKQLLIMDATIVSNDGKLIATASTQFLILPAPAKPAS